MSGSGGEGKGVCGEEAHICLRVDVGMGVDQPVYYCRVAVLRRDEEGGPPFLLAPKSVPAPHRMRALEASMQR